MGTINVDRNAWRERRYKIFNEKIDACKNHSRYEWLRKYANDAMYANEGGGYEMIKAEDFIKRIEEMPVSYIIDWLDNKNNLERKEKYE